MAIDYSQLKRQPCVYAIVNDVSKKVYVGSAKDLKRRFYHHLSDLALNKHSSHKLQNSWDKHGATAFRVVVLMPCEISELIAYEQMFIDFYDAVHSGYNCNPIAESCLGVKHSAKTKALVGAASKKRWQNPDYRAKMVANGKNTPKKKRVLCVETGEVFDGTRDAAKSVGTDGSTVVKIANGKIHAINGYTFRYLDAKGNTIEPVSQRPRALRRAVECDGVEYPSLTKAAKTVGVNLGLASEVANGKREFAKGHTFRYLR